MSARTARCRQRRVRRSAVQLGAQTINLPAPGAPDTIQLGGGSYIALNQNVTTGTSITEQLVDVHLNGVGDVVMGEATSISPVQTRAPASSAAAVGPAPGRRATAPLARARARAPGRPRTRAASVRDVRRGKRDPVLTGHVLRGDLRGDRERDAVCQGGGQPRRGGSDRLACAVRSLPRPGITRTRHAHTSRGKRDA
jgi:hypothetical protein